MTRHFRNNGSRHEAHNEPHPSAPAGADLALEAKVIGAVLGNPGFYAQAAFLETDSFSDQTHAAIWRAITATARAGKTISPASVALTAPDEIEPHGGLDMLARLADYGESIATTFLEAADRLHQHAQWQRIARIATRLHAASTSREKAPDEILSLLIQTAQKTLVGGRDTTRSKREVAQEAIAKALAPRRTVTTGIDSLDFLMQGGLQAGRLYGIGGPFGRGKTILLGSISENLNIQGERHLFTSLETDPADIEIRSCARHIGINAASIFDQEDPDHGHFVAAAQSYINGMPDNVVYEYAPGASIDDLHRSILRAKSRHGIKGFIIDYWQLIRGRERGQNEDSHLRHCADRLAALCRQENLWGLMSAQTDERGDLRISDSLLMAASLFVRLTREENDSAAYFRTLKSNYTRYADTGDASVPGMVFDMVGPYFRTTRPEDIPALAQESENDLSV